MFCVRLMVTQFKFLNCTRLGYWFFVGSNGIFEYNLYVMYSFTPKPKP